MLTVATFDKTVEGKAKFNTRSTFIGAALELLSQMDTFCSQYETPPQDINFQKRFSNSPLTSLPLRGDTPYDGTPSSGKTGFECSQLKI